MKTMLERLGYRVTFRTGSIEAVEAFKANAEAFDLVVTDMTMPKMTGTLLSQKILAIREDMPIILCTGYHENLSEAAVIDMGIGRYLEKPVMTRELHNAINALLDP